MANDNIYKEIGAKLKEARVRNGITLSELAKIMGKSKGTLSKYESGSQAVSCDVLMTLCRLYNVDVSALLPYDDGNDGSLGHNELDKQELWVYWIKGKENTIYPSHLNIDNQGGASSLRLNVKNESAVDDCAFRYVGSVTSTSYSVDCMLKNIAPPYDIMTFNISTVPERVGNFDIYQGMVGAISYSYQNVAVKVIASASPIKDEALIVDLLKVSAHDCEEIYNSNFYTV